MKEVIIISVLSAAYILVVLAILKHIVNINK